MCLTSFISTVSRADINVPTRKKLFENRQKLLGGKYVLLKELFDARATPLKEFLSNSRILCDDSEDEEE